LRTSFRKLEKGKQSFKKRAKLPSKLIRDSPYQLKTATMRAIYFKEDNSKKFKKLYHCYPRSRLYQMRIDLALMKLNARRSGSVSVEISAANPKRLTKSKLSWILMSGRENRSSSEGTQRGKAHFLCRNPTG